MIEVIVAGSGTGAPSLRRAAPSTCVRHNNYTLLLDCGSGTLRQLLKVGISPEQIDAIFLSHFHPDHVGDLVPFLFATKYNLGYRRTVPFTILAHGRVTSLYEDMKNAFGHWVVPPSGLMQIQELEADTRKIIPPGDLKLSFSPVPHTPESLAVRIDTEDGRSIVYSGDTDYSAGLIELAKDAHLFICECACPEGMKMEGHLTPSLAGRMAAEAGCKRLMLTHLYPICDDSNLIEPCRRHYDGELIIAEDLLRLVI
ncbi:MAG: ribonuclease Z [Desulfovibrionales bacterium]|nr:ribonuclease Z [Desulfovibrionales bacterium]